MFKNTVALYNFTPMVWESCITGNLAKIAFLFEILKKITENRIKL